MPLVLLELLSGCPFLEAEEGWMLLFAVLAPAWLVGGGEWLLFKFKLEFEFEFGFELVSALCRFDWVLVSFGWVVVMLFSFTAESSASKQQNRVDKKDMV